MNIPPGYAQVNIRFSGAAAPRGAQLTLGIANTDPAATALAIAQAVGEAYRDNMLPDHPSTLTLESVRAKLGPNETGPEAVQSYNVAGGDTDAATEPQVAMLVSKQTALGGRPNRGRWFVPAIADVGPNSSGVLSSGTVTLWQGNINAFLSALEDFEPVLLHNDEEVAPTPITAMVVQSLVATQRRRLRRVGGRRRTEG